MSTLLFGLGNRLRIKRMNAGYSQTKMAAKLNVSDRTYKFYELEKTEMPASKLVQFCKIFKLEIAWLLTGNGPEKAISEHDLLEEVIVATIKAMGDHALTQKPEKLAKQIRFVYDQAADKGEDPWDAAETLAGLLP